jgi:hypothetical protein
MSPEEANLYRWGGGDGQLPPIERAALHALNQGSWEHGGRIRTLDLPITSRFHAAHWIPPSVVHAGQVDCAVRLVVSRLGSCPWWNDRENVCETVQRFGDDAGLELVAGGVTLRMTDLCGVLGRTCPLGAAGAGPVGAAGLMEVLDRPRHAGVSHHRPAVLGPGPAPTTSSSGQVAQRDGHAGRLRRGRPSASTPTSTPTPLPSWPRPPAR